MVTLSQQNIMEAKHSGLYTKLESLKYLLEPYFPNIYKSFKSIAKWNSC